MSQFPITTGGQWQVKTVGEAGSQQSGISNFPWHYVIVIKHCRIFKPLSALSKECIHSVYWSSLNVTKYKFAYSATWKGL